MHPNGTWNWRRKPELGGLKATVGLTEGADDRRKSVVTRLPILSDVLSTHERLLLANRIHETAALSAILARLT